MLAKKLSFKSKAYRHTTFIKKTIFVETPCTTPAPAPQMNCIFISICIEFHTAAETTSPRLVGRRFKHRGDERIDVSFGMQDALPSPPSPSPLPLLPKEKISF